MKVIKETDDLSAKIAANSLQAGEIIAIPTDTIYGLAVDASNDKAVKKIYELKKRSNSKPIAVFAANLKKAQQIVEFNSLAIALINKFPNQPLTLILPKKESPNYKLSPFLNLNDNFIGIRIVKHDFIVKLFKEFDGFLAITSANISGQESAQCLSEVENYFSNDLNLIIQGAKSLTKSPSMVIKITDNNYQIIRGGNIDELSIKSLINS
jgi:L-threonylcarbamoyladenylate synthase